MKLELQEKIKNKIDIFLKESGLELIEFKIFTVGGKYILRCVVDFFSGGVTLNDCAKLNEKIFSFIDNCGILGDDFTVEVNSPGLDRPLKLAKDFYKIKGRNVELWLNELVGKNTYLEGEIVDVEENYIFLRVKGDILKIELNRIKFGREKIEV